MKRLLIVLLVLSPAMAQQIPDEATKRCALLRAYRLNGDSMVRMGSIDLSGEPDTCGKPVKTIPIKPENAPKGKLR